MTEILWITPDKPENLSVGRRQIAKRLENRGYSITQVGNRKTALRKAAIANYNILITTSAVGGIAGPIAKKRGKDYIVDYVDPILQLRHSGTLPMAHLGHYLQSVAFRACDRIIYTYAEETLRVSRFDKPTVKTTLGVDYDRFVTAEPTTDFDLPEVYAVYIGGLEDIYNIETLLQSAIGNYNVVIAGDGKHRDLVEIKAQEHAEITYLGLIDHSKVPQILADADVGVNLVDDPHTVKVLEYAAAGLPIVHAEGRAETVLPNSVRFTPIESESVSQAVNHAMSDRTHPELQQYAKQRDYEQVADDYERIIEGEI